jgi:hypothetical protein
LTSIHLQCDGGQRRKGRIRDAAVHRTGRYRELETVAYRVPGRLIAGKGKRRDTDKGGVRPESTHSSTAEVVSLIGAILSSVQIGLTGGSASVDGARMIL